MLIEPYGIAADSLIEFYPPPATSKDYVPLQESNGTRMDIVVE